MSDAHLRPAISTPCPIQATAYSVYIHIPFCTHRCGYCDFNTYAGLQDLIPDYTTALIEEIRWMGGEVDKKLPIHTIFFGGGTPSLLPIAEIERILSALRSAFALQEGAEITLEANPGTLAADYLVALRRLGVNRLSLGVQSANPGELRLLERQHDYSDVTRAVSWARRAGFDNLNLDLIFGLPEQPLSAWQRTLELTLDLAPEHFSLYALSLEHGTPFGAWARRGLLSTPDPDTAADMYEWASEKLAMHGYTQYEISNWARHDAGGNLLTCRHNLQYWRNLPYLGLGAGAHGYANGLRTANVLSPMAYIERLHPDNLSAAPAEAQRQIAFPRTPATQTAQPIDRTAEIGETMMMGLRLVQEGVSAEVFQRRFGQPLEELFGAQIRHLIQLGLLEWSDTCLRLTQRGRLLGNRVFVEFL
ncbi:MAG: radical SAM family heme chaperone HemW [Anaerolineales bacterium]|nr:radical SAM family heme chaperone HemW [Anaerolineales bacterium]